ncbi:MAG: hypothetical protein PHR77_20460 [Kiritimatiellae bacterium]|nr:hypothetical protein [Kiritimatiellia bacterium]MDD5521074.1 hypothetical protein [Kiritimatiellia bacterium]
MKRIIAALAILIVLSFAVQIVLHAASEVASVNVVGYMKVSVPSNGLALVGLNLESLSTQGMNVANLVSNQLPQGSWCHIWSRATLGYISTSRTRGGWGLPGGTSVLMRGDAFWMQVPASAATGALHEVVLMGEVPDSIGADATTTVNNINLSAVGYPYPADILWTNTTLAKAGKIGDWFHYWTRTNQSWQSWNKTRGGWGTASTLVINPGDGFWYQTSATNWTELCPYNLH